MAIQWPLLPSPTKSGKFESILFIVVVLSFILMLVALVSPHWCTFTSLLTGNVFSLGLWQVCVNDICQPAWESTSILYANQVPPARPQRFQQGEVPPMLLAADIFFMFGIVSHLVACSLWSRGPGWIGLSLIMPATFYTIALACCIEFFGSRFPFAASIEWVWDHAAICGFIGFGMIWLCVILYFGGFLVRLLVQRARDKKHEAFELTDSPLEYIRFDDVQDKPSK